MLYHPPVLNRECMLQVLNFVRGILKTSHLVGDPLSRIHKAICLYVLELRSSNLMKGWKRTAFLQLSKTHRYDLFSAFHFIFPQLIHKQLRFNSKMKNNESSSDFYIGILTFHLWPHDNGSSLWRISI